MRRVNRKYFRHFPRAFIVCFLAMLVMMSSLIPTVTVYADPSDKYRPIEHMVVVSDCGWFLSDLKNAMHGEESTDDGGNTEYNSREGTDHRFVSWGDTSGIKNAVNELRKDDQDVAVVFWMGFDIVNDTTSFSHDEIAKVEDSAKLKDMRTVRETKKDADGNVMKDDHGDDIIIERQEEYETDQNQYHYEVKTVNCYKKAAERYTEELTSSGLSEWFSTNKIKYYFASLPPNKGYEKEDYTSTKETTKVVGSDNKPVLDDSGNAKTTTREKAKSELWGYWAKKWNEALSSAGSVVDIWDAASESKLYFTNTKHDVGIAYQGSKTHGGGSGTNSGEWVDEDANHPGYEAEQTVTADVGDKEYNESDAKNSGSNAFAYYELTDESLQQLFHIIFNTVQDMNPRPSSGDAVSQSMYSITASLTTYVNNVLSSNADEDHKDHKILKTVNSGNAGALLGYGDKKNFDFLPFITQDRSKTSSVIAYDALKLDSGQLDDALQYARYGKLLNDLGLDSYGSKHTGGASLSRVVGGGLMYIGFVFSAFASKVYEIFIDLVIFLNPFRFFTKTGSAWSTSLGNNVANLDKTMFGSGATGVSKKFGDILNNGIMDNITSLTSSWYNDLTTWSWGFFIPIGLAFMIFMLFMYSSLFGKKHSQQYASKRTNMIKTFVFRFLFVAIGIPFCGLIYTGVLTNLDAISSEAKSPSAQIVASTFVDFSEWAKKLRLTPIGDGMVTSTEDAVEGTATAESLAKLRKTALLINQKTGVIDGSVGSIGGVTNTDWTVDMVTNSATNSRTTVEQCQTLIKGYMSDNFYYPSDWESDVHDAMSSDSSIKTGRRAGGEEKNFKADKEQGEDTMYNMYDSTNEVDDWMQRELKDNNDIFKNNVKWKGFNIFDNGTSLTSNGVNANTIKFENNGSLSDTALGTSPKNNGGLSTLSMYNYLSSKFDSDGVIVYSNSNSTNIQSRASHRSINVIGSGTLGVLYYLNSLVILIVIAILGIYYLFASMVSVLKKGFEVITSIPGTALGMMKSIATVIATTISMIIEIVTIGFVYELVTELFMVFIQIIQNVFDASVFSADPTMMVVGGLSASSGTGSMAESLLTSGTMVYGNLIFTTLTIGLVGVVAYKYHRAYGRAFGYVQDKLFARLLDERLVKKMAEKKAVSHERVLTADKVLQSGVSFCTFIKEFLADVLNLLYNHDMDLRVSS